LGNNKDFFGERGLPPSQDFSTKGRFPPSRDLSIEKGFPPIQDLSCSHFLFMTWFFILLCEGVPTRFCGMYEVVS